jgi:hypothetical protein
MTKLVTFGAYLGSACLLAYATWLGIYAVASWPWT